MSKTWLGQDANMFKSRYQPRYANSYLSALLNPFAVSSYTQNDGFAFATNCSKYAWNQPPACGAGCSEADELQCWS